MHNLPRIIAAIVSREVRRLAKESRRWQREAERLGLLAKAKADSLDTATGIVNDLAEQLRSERVRRDRGRVWLGQDWQQQ